MQEIWKDIKGFEGRYQVSNYGRVKSLARIVKRGQNGYRNIKETILSPRTDTKRGYQTISIRIHSKRYNLSLHRLVAETFIPNPNNYPVINHIDGNPSNNNVNNLEWCTQSYNVKYSYTNGNAKPTPGCFKKGNIPHNLTKVNQYDLEGNYIQTFNSIKLAAKSINKSPTGISNCLNHCSNTCGGYIWKYADK